MYLNFMERFWIRISKVIGQHLFLVERVFHGAVNV